MHDEPNPIAPIRLNLSRREAYDLALLLDWAIDESVEVAEQADEDGEADTVKTFRGFAETARSVLLQLERRGAIQ